MLHHFNRVCLQACTTGLPVRSAPFRAAFLLLFALFSALFAFSGASPAGAANHSFTIDRDKITIAPGKSGYIRVTVGDITGSPFPASDMIALSGTWAGTLTSYESAVTVEGVTANITLSNVDIRTNADLTCAFMLTGGASVDLTLSGENILKSGLSRAGLQVQSGERPRPWSRSDLIVNSLLGARVLEKSDEKLLIRGTDADKLTAESAGSAGGTSSAGIGGSGGAGIGGGSGHGGSITIVGGTVTAIGGSNYGYSGGAGIGGGYGGNGGDIRICGGTVNAVGGGEAAGIGGGGFNGSGGDIRIIGGMVTATGGRDGAGIGGGRGSGGGIIKISGGTVTAHKGAGSGMDIGYGGGVTATPPGDIITITGGNVRP